MKYLVMECHAGYAVLMDEESRFVNAANLHYEVGQTVTEPILLETENKQKTGSRRIIMHAVKMAAAAACLKGWALRWGQGKQWHPEWHLRRAPVLFLFCLPLFSFPSVVAEWCTTIPRRRVALRRAGRVQTARAQSP